MLKEEKILFLGAGSMAEAMVSGMINRGKIQPKQITVSNRTNLDRLNQLEKSYNINGITKDRLNIGQYDIIILAMKPKDAQASLKSINDQLHHKQLVLSVLAGVSTTFLETYLPSQQQVIRVMPNTSSMIGESATAISSGTYTTNENMKLALELLKSIGEVYMIPEKMMDVFTGIAGSGPAYIYYLVEQMEKEGKTQGLTEEMVRRIISQTILGAAKMINSLSETPTVLRQRVTSPNGTTAAGLEALETFGGGTALVHAIKQATNRSKEISEHLDQIALDERPLVKTKMGTEVIR